MSGETYEDFAAGLRDVVGRNRVVEWVLLAPFLRYLDNTPKKLVQQRPKPKTLEESVDKATEIDDHMDNVAQGMAKNGQSWAVAPSHRLMTMTDTTGLMCVIPGISGTGHSMEMANPYAAGGKTVALPSSPTLMGYGTSARAHATHSPTTRGTASFRRRQSNVSCDAR